MIARALRRLGQGAVSVAILITVVFFAGRLTGDPLQLLVPDDATPDVRDRMAQELGLDRPLWQQFVSYLGDLLHGDLGDSLRLREPVTQLYVEAIPNTMGLLVPAFLITILLGVPLGVWSATSRSRIVRSAIDRTSDFGLSAPTFWVAIVLVLLFSVKLGALPASGMGGPDHYILPVVCVVVLLSAGVIRVARLSTLESLNSDYVKFARIRGLSERRILWKHVLRNAVNPILSYVGVLITMLVTGSLVVETVFAWPGLGRLTYDAILARDFPIIQGVILLSSIFIIMLNFLLDALHTRLDPRSER